MAEKEFDLVAYVQYEARAGNMWPLIGRVSSGTLTPDERKFVSDLLERLQGKRGETALREIEQDLIRLQVEGLMEDKNWPKEAAVTEVMRDRDRSRATIFNAIRAARKRKAERESKRRESK